MVLDEVGLGGLTPHEMRRVLGLGKEATRLAGQAAIAALGEPVGLARLWDEAER